MKLWQSDSLNTTLSPEHPINVCVHPQTVVTAFGSVVRSTLRFGLECTPNVSDTPLPLTCGVFMEQACIEGAFVLFPNLLLLFFLGAFPR